jgi:hypothetical protein
MDEWKFPASSATEAEAKIRVLSAPMWGMDWENYFVTLEGEDGLVLSTWLHGLLHA